MTTLLKFLQLLYKHAHPFEPKFRFDLWKKEILNEDKTKTSNFHCSTPRQKSLKNIFFNLRVLVSTIISALLEKTNTIEIEKDFFYIRIPKCASTTINSILLGKIYDINKLDHFTDDQIDLIAENSLKHVSHKNSGYHFAIVRNPLHRLVSAYEAIFGNENKFIYQNLYLGAFQYNDDFKSFVQKLSCIPDCLMDQNVRPQNTFIKENTQIFKLEKGLKPLSNIHPMFKDIKAHKNQTEYSKEWWKYYDLDTLNTAEKIYAKDIDLLNYSDEIIEIRRKITEISK